MRAIRSKNTEIELLMGKALWSLGLRYRKTDKTVFGKPDFCFKKYKIAIFCDSEFFHGKDWDSHKNDFKNNKEFWINKIEKNIKRDEEVNAFLQNNGWSVIRFWGKEIYKNMPTCIETIKYIFEIKKNEYAESK